MQCTCAIKVQVVFILHNCNWRKSQLDSRLVQREIEVRTKHYILLVIDPKVTMMCWLMTIAVTDTNDKDHDDTNSGLKRTDKLIYKGDGAEGRYTCQPNIKPYL